VACLLGGALAGPAHAQAPARLSGQAFLDYYYQIASPDADAEGHNGFTYRRLYLTADGAISDALSARARLEASEATLGTRGPQPFVKDLYLHWKVGGGHALTLGLGPTPIFSLTEAVWGYRSLERTLTDAAGVVSSRDLGVRADGPLGSDALRYSLMVGNNSGVFPETDDEYKRVYGQLAYRPAGGLTLAAAASWADYEGPRDTQLLASAVVGFVTDTWRAGLEGFYDVGTYARAADAASYGASLFGAARVAGPWSLVGRVDRVHRERHVVSDTAPVRLGTADLTRALAAVVYQPHPRVQLMPNALLVKEDDADRADLLARLTLAFDF
jgi:hypothetical protein